MLSQLARNLANELATLITVLLVGLIPAHLYLSLSMAETVT